MPTFRTPFTLALTAVAIGLAGCTGEPAGNGPETSPPPPTVDMNHDHDHPSEGPHHGELIELGNEEYHAELVHEDGAVSIYILDRSARELVPIGAPEVTINLVHDAQPQQFALSASPQEGDASGRASRFTSTDAALADALDHEDSNARLAVTIAGKAYTGRIVHSHAGHAHDHPH
jgi:hypothetical protein